MIKQYCCILSLIFTSISIRTDDRIQAIIPHVTDFTNLNECIARNMQMTHLLQESDSMQWIVCIPNGIVINDGAIVTNEGLILKDTETYLDDQHRLLNSSRNIAQEESVFFDGKLVVIASPGQENWYHWLLQVLPRLKIVAESGIAYDKIYVSNAPYAWQQESLRIVLEKLNIPLNAILTSQPDSIIQAKELIVPSIPFAPAKGRRVLPQWLTAFIHDCFLPNINLATPKKLYISRSNATSRRISNEKELINFLKERDFEIVHLEMMPICKQAYYFSQASIIIGPHGSGFVNLIFSKPNTAVIEIDHGLSGEEQRSFYKRMSKLMNCTYYPFYTDETTEEHLDDDLLVDINAFAQLLDTVVLDS